MKLGAICQNTTMAMDSLWAADVILIFMASASIDLAINVTVVTLFSKKTHLIWSAN